MVEFSLPKPSKRPVFKKTSRKKRKEKNIIIYIFFFRKYFLKYSVFGLHARKLVYVCGFFMLYKKNKFLSKFKLVFKFIWSDMPICLIARSLSVS